MNWKHKDEWSMRGNDFMVVVSRHEVSSDHYEGPHRWCVYAYIYPKHPHFAKFDGPDMWQSAASCLPIHSYPSLLKCHTNDGVVTAVQVGADYNHLHDDQFTHYATKEEAYSVFEDADELFNHLEARIGEEVPA